MAIVVARQDPRYEALNTGHNVRWPAEEADRAGRIVICESASDAAEALQQIVSAGMRPTIRSGAHCYEDFVVNNPGGAILDLSLLAGVTNLRRQQSNHSFNRRGTFSHCPWARCFGMFTWSYTKGLG